MSGTTRLARWRPAHCAVLTLVLVLAALTHSAPCSRFRAPANPASAALVLRRKPRREMQLSFDLMVTSRQVGVRILSPRGR